MTFNQIARHIRGVRTANLDRKGDHKTIVRGLLDDLQKKTGALIQVVRDVPEEHNFQLYQDLLKAEKAAKFQQPDS